MLIFLDAVRADAITVDTAPNLSRFMSRGLRFTRAYAPAPWTVPSHLSVVTGIPSTQLGVDFVHQSIGGRFETLAERFHRAGYRTAAVLANPFPNEGTGMQRGYDLFEYPRSRVDLRRTALVTITEWWLRYFDLWSRWDADDVASRALRFLRRPNGTLFLTLNVLDAHDPYDLTRRCSPRTAGGYRGRYNNAIRCMDAALGELLDVLDREVTRGTMVVAIVGDHGEQFGEHGMWFHGNSLYASVLHVPLSVRGLGLPDQEFGGAVSTTGLFAALSIASRIQDTAQVVRAIEQVEVVSFLRAPRDKEQWSIMNGHYHLIAGEDDTMKLFDLSSDPAETKNLWDQRALEPVRVDFAKRFETIRKKTVGTGPADTPFKGLGYVR